ncbi:putative bifunctional diguanylate cyclase/phosphodiesterase [Clostridium thermarum]|uniref:putative bifunctional diguanylate cyclase/phosphodiesterase n=1 Tax=Clostridium thermarum TaxID=1716543 RepID=UPI00111F11A3|nr:EAL domain-containing protein [Clostridium thermarum]
MGNSVNESFFFFENYKTLVYSSLGTLILLMSFIAVLLFYIWKIKRMKKELEENHKELTELYEELASTDEEVRAQYEELACTQETLTNTEERYRLVLESTNDAIWDIDFNTGNIYLSEKWYELLGYNPEECEQSIWFWRKFVQPDDIHQIFKALKQHLKNKVPYFNCEFRIKNVHGDYIWIRSRGKAQYDSEGKVYRVMGSHMDITELKDYEAELQYVAYHDALTGLNNRLYLYDTIGLYLSQHKNSNTMDAMLFIDTDNFKFVNDTLGHSFGDKFLLMVAMRLLTFTGDNCELFRLGGDEFIIYIKNAENKSAIEAYANKIIDSFSEPFNIDGNSISTSVSIGISLFPYDGTDVDTLLKYADMAMYKVKERGKNGFRFYNSILNDEIQARVKIEKHLRKALENNEFILHYQPQVNVQTKKVEAFEALVRWQSPELGLVSPLKFIHVAEETGFIVPLGEWILKNSCQFLKALNAAKGTDYKVSVNISVMQLLQDNFTDMVERILADTGLSPSLLELEITESIIMESPDLIVGKLKLLREKGISIALDDFGTGYSSLAYLRKIPITTLKIDKLFIDDISSAGCNTSLTDSIIDLGHKIGLTIVAEGVETNDQLEYLESNNCDIIQGYLFSKPLPPSEIHRIL